MIKSLFIRFIYLFLIFCINSILFADSTEIKFKVATHTDLLLNEKPNIESFYICKVPFNSEVTGYLEDAVEDTVDGYIDKWYLVRYKNYSGKEEVGYLWGRYLVITSMDYRKDIISGGIITKNKTNLFSESDTNSEVIRKLDFGIIFYVVDKKAFVEETSGRKRRFFWYKVVFPYYEETGWITSKEGIESYFWREALLRDNYAGFYFSVASNALGGNEEYDVAERLFKIILEKYSDAEVPIIDWIYNEIYMSDAFWETMNSLAWTYKKQENYKKAVEQFKKISDDVKFSKEKRTEAFWNILKIYKEDLKDYRSLIRLSHEAIKKYKNESVSGFEWNLWIDIEAAEYIRSSLKILNVAGEEFIQHGERIIEESNNLPVVILGNIILCDGYKKLGDTKKVQEIILSTVEKYPSTVRRYYVTPFDYSQMAIAEIIRYYVEELSDYKSAMQFCKIALDKASDTSLVKNLTFAQAQLSDIWEIDKDSVIKVYKECRGVIDYINNRQGHYYPHSKQRLNEIKSFIEYEAVVLEPELSVRQKPLSASKELFTLTKGDKVTVLYQNPSFFDGRWFKIKIKNKLGWVEEESVKNVNIKELNKVHEKAKWEFYRKDLENTGSVDGNPIIKPQLLWQIPRVNVREVIYYDVNEDMITDLIISGYEDEYLAVLDGKTQNVIWKASIKCSNIEYFSPLVYKNHVVFGNGGAIKFFNIRNGQLEKTINISKVSAPISIYDGRVFIQTSEYEKKCKNKIIGIDIDSEKIVWESVDEYPNGNSALAIDKKEKLLYVVSSFGGKKSLSAVNLNNGKHLWTFFMRANPCRVSPVIYEDFVLVGSNDWYLYILNKYTGELHYEFNVGQPLTAELSVNNGIVIAGSPNYRLYAVDIKEGKKIWEFVAKGGFRAAPCIINNVVYAGDLAGFIYAVDLKTGRLIWEYEAKDGIGGSISSNGNMISFVTGTNNLFVLGNPSE